MIENEVAQMTRKERLIASMPSNIDALFITNTKNQFYLTGFDYTDGLVVVTRDKSYVFADFRYIEAAKNETSSEFEVVLLEGKRGELYKSYLNNYKTIGFEDASLTYEELKTYEKILPDFEFVPAGRIVEELRTVKDESELETIIEAQRIAEKAFEEILNFIKAGVSERQIATELEYRMKLYGAEDISFETIAGIASGTTTSL
jgi:Xaa-Pro aminopeptidase